MANVVDSLPVTQLGIDSLVAAMKTLCDARRSAHVRRLLLSARHCIDVDNEYGRAVALTREADRLVSGIEEFPLEVVKNAKEDFILRRDQHNLCYAHQPVPEFADALCVPGVTVPSIETAFASP